MIKLLKYVGYASMALGLLETGGALLSKLATLKAKADTMPGASSGRAASIKFQGYKVM